MLLESAVDKHVLWFFLPHLPRCVRAPAVPSDASFLWSHLIFRESSSPKSQEKRNGPHVAWRKDLHDVGG
jgi:hypothetical protein